VEPSVCSFLHSVISQHCSEAHRVARGAVHPCTILLWQGSTPDGLAAYQSWVLRRGGNEAKQVVPPSTSSSARQRASSGCRFFRVCLGAPLMGQGGCASIRGAPACAALLLLIHLCVCSPAAAHPPVCTQPCCCSSTCVYAALLLLIHLCVRSPATAHPPVCTQPCCCSSTCVRSSGAAHPPVCAALLLLIHLCVQPCCCSSNCRTDSALACVLPQRLPSSAPGVLKRPDCPRHPPGRGTRAPARPTARPPK